MVGRDNELALLSRLLPDPDVALLTLTGPPGVGKTRLAMAAASAVAHEFPDGVVFVDLTAVRDPDLVPAEIAGSLGVEGDPRTTDRLSQVLLGSRLLILDNFEHVMSAAEPLAGLLATHPSLTVLVTSRERLHLHGEREFVLAPLALPGPSESADPDRLAATPAVALLVHQVRAFDPSFAVTGANREALAEICIRLDGLPLALELAAPRLRLFTPTELLFRLRHRVGSLSADVTDVPDRHRTLSAALAWSHNLLGPDERAMFRRLSVFVGGWTMDAAGRICAVDDPVDTVASLVDKSLLRRMRAEGPVARFTMLESLRQFAADQLGHSDETQLTRARHADYFAELAWAIVARVGTPEERAAIDDVGRDIGNLREALACMGSSSPDSALPIAVALGWYCFTRGQLGEGGARLETAIAAVGDSPDVSAEALASAHHMAGAIALARGDVARAELHLTASLRVNQDVGSVRLEAIATAFLGHVSRFRGRPDEAVARYTEAGRLFEQMGNAHGMAWSRYDLGLLARRGQDQRRSARLLEDSLGTFRQLQYEWAIGCSAWALATVQLSLRRVEEAAVLLEEALAAFESSDDFRGVAQCLEASAAVGVERSDPRSAAQLLGAAATLRAGLAAPLPAEERAAKGALELRLRQALGSATADQLQLSGRSLPAPAATDLARRVLAAGEAGPRPTAPAVTGALTPRETEVADLVRAGCTNRQIGRRLGISEKTTEAHVHSIIGKLGVRSRAEIAAWVAIRSSTARDPTAGHHGVGIDP